jgi:hypothetical protein
MALMRTHGRGERQVLGSGTVIAGPRQCKAEPELGIIVARASLDDPPEVSGRGRILAGVELGARQRLQYAPGPRLCRGGALEELGGRRRTAPAKQVQATFVELMAVGAVSGNRMGSIL